MTKKHLISKEEDAVLFHFAKNNNNNTENKYRLCITNTKQCQKMINNVPCRKIEVAIDIAVDVQRTMGY